MEFINQIFYFFLELGALVYCHLQSSNGATLNPANVFSRLEGSEYINVFKAYLFLSPHTVEDEQYPYNRSDYKPSVSKSCAAQMPVLRQVERETLLEVLDGEK